MTYKYKLPMLFVLAFSAGVSPTHAADLGSKDRGNSGDYEVLSTPGSSVNWSGFYISGSLGRNSTSHDVQAHGEASSLQATSDIYAHTAAGGAVTYNSEKCATDEEQCKLVVTKGTPLPSGANGDALLKDHGDLVGFVVDPASVADLGLDGSAKGFTGSLGLGYDLQMSHWLIGIMGDYQFRNAKTTIGGVEATQSDAFFLGGRLGFFPTNKVLVYGLGGYTWLYHDGLKGKLAEAEAAAGLADGKNGWTISNGDGGFGGFTLGGGAEFALTRTVFLGVEGRHTWYGKEDIVTANWADAPGNAARYKFSGNVTDEPTEWYVGATLKVKLNGDSLGGLK